MKAFKVLFKALGLSFQREKDPSKGGRALLFGVFCYCSFCSDDWSPGFNVHTP
jgi:hypothetical protein